MTKIEKAEIKQLRADARRLTTIANHLRERAKNIARLDRQSERAEKARNNFFSKKSAIDPELTLLPEIPPGAEAIIKAADTDKLF